MAHITLDIPSERYGEFLVMVGTWLAGETPGPATTLPERSSWTTADGALAEQILRRMTPVARRLFGRLALGHGDLDDGHWSAAALTNSLGLNNANELAGMLAWPGRYCYQAARGLPFHWENTEESGAVYWMDDDIGGVFNHALEAADPGLWRQLNGDSDD